MSRVSVIVPLRDGAAYVGEALASVLEGTRAPDEVIVVDDGSSDDGPAIAEAVGSPVRVLRRPPAGIGAATNAGLAEASGDLIGFIDADDLWTPEKLASQLAALAADESLDAVFGRAREFHSPDLEPAERDRVLLRAGDHPMRLRGTMLARRGLIDRVGGFDESLTVGEFVDWHDRAERSGMRSLMLDEVVLHRRLHSSNHGRRATGSRLDYVRVARAALERRRAAEGGA